MKGMVSFRQELKAVVCLRIPATFPERALHTICHGAT